MTPPMRGLLRQVRTPGDLWRRREGRYLLVGGFNTLVGYSLGVGLYLALSPLLHILVIGVIANILAITVSFTTYKHLVFRTHGHWLEEYLRSYVVYGGTAVLGIMLLWLLVDGLRLPIWVAQGIAMLLTVIVSYLGHARFTFRRS
jgi:putative flippase GtrA